MYPDAILKYYVKKAEFDLTFAEMMKLLRTIVNRLGVLEKDQEAMCRVDEQLFKLCQSLQDGLEGRLLSNLPDPGTIH